MGYLTMGYHKPDVITSTILFKGLCLNGDVYEALQLHAHLINEFFLQNDLENPTV